MQRGVQQSPGAPQPVQQLVPRDRADQVHLVPDAPPLGGPDEPVAIRPVAEDPQDRLPVPEVTQGPHGQRPALPGDEAADERDVGTARRRRPERRQLDGQGVRQHGDVRAA
jgi:hypothetical protein